jgi:predicted outer membrane repeat protein
MLLSEGWYARTSSNCQRMLGRRSIPLPVWMIHLCMHFVGPQGGGILFVDPSELRITNASFTNNSAQLGGGLHCEGCTEVAVLG